MVTNLSRSWWVLILRGLAAIVFGVLAYLWPGLTFTVLVLLFGAYALWDGVFALIGALRHESSRRWALVLEGIAGIVAGLVTFLWTGAATVALLFIIAVWAVVTGVMEIAAAIRLREEIHGELFLMLMGLLSVVFGVAIVIYPAAGLLAITWMIAAYAILFGILQIVLGFRVRRHAEDRMLRV
jgi:uncharacterized membrane protein HdeD (DUF308 family)